MYKIYHWLALHIWRKYMRSLKHTPHPVGIPYERDPDARCEFYEPFRPAPGQKWYFTDCETDGHYLCKKCIHNVANDRLQAQQTKGDE